MRGTGMEAPPGILSRHGDSSGGQRTKSNPLHGKFRPAPSEAFSEGGASGAGGSKGTELARRLLFPTPRMDLDECLRIELAALIDLVDRVTPRLADTRPWPLRLASALFGSILL